jgi:release factor glutamine methyltransferase
LKAELGSGTELVTRLESILQSGGVDATAREARWLLEATTSNTPTKLWQNAAVSEAAERHVLELAERRAAGEPLQYVVGSAAFRRLDLAVGPGVFIPRPETELVAETAMSLVPDRGLVVDVGTGSGAIALSIADERPDVRVVATEPVPEAAAWARHNVARLRAPVSLVECDLLDGLAADLRGVVDVVVSNPPYIPDSDRSLLPVEVVDHEPPAALFAGPRGTEVVERLARESRSWLRPGGWLVVEIGDRQSEAATSLLREQGFSEVTIGSDLAGRPRIARARWP